jgi:hypothetical protein
VGRIRFVSASWEGIERLPRLLGGSSVSDPLEQRAKRESVDRAFGILGCVLNVAVPPRLDELEGIHPHGVLERRAPGLEFRLGRVRVRDDLLAGRRGFVLAGYHYTAVSRGRMVRHCFDPVRHPGEKFHVHPDGGPEVRSSGFVSVDEALLALYQCLAEEILAGEGESLDLDDEDTIDDVFGEGDR